MMISCVSESSGALTETLRTLRFSMSAARIRNKPIRFLDPQEKLIMELREEIKRLRNENKALRVGIDNSVTSEPKLPHQQPVRRVSVQEPMETPMREQNRWEQDSGKESSLKSVHKVKVNPKSLMFTTLMCDFNRATTDCQRPVRRQQKMLAKVLWHTSQILTTMSLSCNSANEN